MERQCYVLNIPIEQYDLKSKFDGELLQNQSLKCDSELLLT